MTMKFLIIKYEVIRQSDGSVYGFVAELSTRTIPR